MCENTIQCPCPKTHCSCHGKCCACVQKHTLANNLPFCLTPQSKEKKRYIKKIEK